MPYPDRKLEITARIIDKVGAYDTVVRSASTQQFPPDAFSMEAIEDWIKQAVTNMVFTTATSLPLEEKEEG